MNQVTVAIPTYNAERYIKESLESVLSQTYRMLEVIVMDERSTDRTLEIVQSFDDSRIRIHRNPERLGIGRNWNQGLRLGTGPYVIIHHQDDIMAPDGIERKVAFLDEQPSAGFVYSRVEVIDEEGGKLPNQLGWFSNDLFDRDQLFDSIQFFMALLLGKNLICCPSVLLRREAALKINGFDEDMPFALDWEMWLRMAAAYPVGYVDAVTTYYRWHEENESLKYLGHFSQHHFDARSSAVKRSIEFVNRWSTDEVLHEMISLTRQIEERSNWARGLEIIAPPRPEQLDFVGSELRIRELIGEIRHPRDRIRSLCREILRLDSALADSMERIKEFDESTTFQLGWLLMVPVRWVSRLWSRSK